MPASFCHETSGRFRMRATSLNPPLRRAETPGMSRLVTIVLLLLLAPAAAGGPIRVEIRPDPEPRDPFVVSVTGHYADFHNGYSRRWKEVPFRAGARGFIALGPVNPILNMGVSVSVYHPEYVSEWARSKKTPLLLRPVSFETFRPRTWKSALARGEPIENDLPNYLLGQILGHLQIFLLTYLPAMDQAEGDLIASDASLRAHLPFLEELVGFAMTEAAAERPRRFVSASVRADPAFMRGLAEQDRKTRVEVRELLYRIREWLSVPRSERVAMRRLMQEMRYGRNVSQELMGKDDLAQLGAFLDRYQNDREAKREPESATSWANPVNRIEYRVRIIEPPRRCSYLTITTDLTGVVSADLGDMTSQVKARFCRRASGEWRYGTS
jgi:hypothetical protein